MTDLSVGWGHNSQWRTPFRRDYVTDGLPYYNVDRSTLENVEPEPLGQIERLELLRHRCSTRRDLGDDTWPYDDVLVERAP